MTYQPDWDIDLRDGKAGEDLVRDTLLLTDEQIEVKTDRKARSTGNLYIETHCRRRDGWHPSGINTTKATAWFFVLDSDDKLMVSITTEALKRQVARFGRRVAEERDGTHPTKGVLVPLAGLLREAIRVAA